MVIKGNWFLEDYTLPVIGITYCKDRPGKKAKCAPKNETDVILKKYPLFFVHQKTHVWSEMFSDHEYVDRWPYLGDKEHYFPTVSNTGSINYGSAKISGEDNHIILDEISFSLH